MQNKLLKKMVLFILIVVMLDGCSSVNPDQNKSSFEPIAHTSSTPYINTSSSTVFRPIPDAALTEMYSTTYLDEEVYLEYCDPDNGIHKLPLPIEKATHSFVSSEIMAVVDSKDNSLFGVTSQDKGITWNDFRIPIETNISTSVSNIQIGFTSPQDGWIVCQNTRNKESGKFEYFLYQTNDGGFVWSLISRFEMEVNSLSFVFASPEIGWASLNSSTPSKKNPEIYETFNSGKTWDISVFEIDEELLYGFNMMDATIPKWKNGHWVIELVVYRNVGYPNPSFIPFILNKYQDTWIWNNPDWSVPEGISQIQFSDYVQFYLFPPKEYDSSIGLGNQPDIWLLFNTVEHMARVSDKNIDTYVGETIPFEKVKTMAKVLYGDSNFNIDNAASYWEINAPTSPNEGYIYLGQWPKNEEQTIIDIQSVISNTDGTIEVIIERKEYPYPYYDVPFLQDLVVSYQKCLFSPAEFDGIQYFTLLKSETIIP